MLWLDALVANVDRSWRNPNLLVWHGRLWLIDHGAALWFHHRWASGRRDPERFARAPYDVVRPRAVARHLGAVPAAAAALAPQVTRDLLHEVVGLVPDEWLAPVPGPRDRRPSCGRRTSSTCSRGWRPHRPGSPVAA